MFVAEIWTASGWLGGRSTCDSEEVVEGLEGKNIRIVATYAHYLATVRFYCCHCVEGVRKDGKSFRSSRCLTRVLFSALYSYTLKNNIIALFLSDWKLRNSNIGARPLKYLTQEQPATMIRVDTTRRIPEHSSHRRALP